MFPTDVKVQIPVPRLTLAQQFLITSLVIVLAGMTGIGFWVTNRIESGIVNRTAASTALYVDSLVGGSLQSMTTEPAPNEDGVRRLDWLLNGTSLGQEIAIFRVWNRDGTIAYSNLPDTVGLSFPPDAQQARAWNGAVSAHIDEPEHDEVLSPNAPNGSMLEIYSPVRNRDTDDVIAVAEFYYRIEDLKREVAEAQQRSWFVVGGTGVAIYLLLAIFVQRASNTIAHQQRELASQVDRLTDLLRQNDDLNDRVRTAAARTTALNERVLRRLSAELHDGPAQDISLALLQLDHVYATTVAGAAKPPTALGEVDADLAPAGVPPNGRESANGHGVSSADLDLIQGSLRRALREVRSTSTGLLLPQLSQLSLAETVDHVARVHRRRTAHPLTISADDLPDQAPTVTKIALYRVIQEALANGSRHAGGAGQAVRVAAMGDSLHIAVSDTGPGFDTSTIDSGGEHLGLIGMRERIESLGGEFRVESTTSGARTGTTVVAVLPLHPTGDRGEGDG